MPKQGLNSGTNRPHATIALRLLCLVPILAASVMGFPLRAVGEACATTTASPTALLVSRGEHGLSHGVGSWIGPTTILTTRHVVGVTGTISVRYPDGSWQSAEAVVWEDPAHDIILLRASQPAGVRPLRIRRTRLADSTPATMRTETWQGQESRDAQVYPQIWRHWAGSGLQCRLRVKAKPGDSGAPVIDSNGDIIAIVGGLSSTSRAYCISVERVPEVPVEVERGLAQWQSDVRSTQDGKGLQLLQTGETALVSGDVNRAIVALDGALRIGVPSALRPLALTQLATMLRRAGDRGRAATIMEQACSITGDDPGPWLTRGWMAIADGDYSVAKFCFSKASDVAPCDAEPFIGLGLAAASAGLIEESLTAYQRAAEIEPWASDVRTGIAYALRRKGKIEPALRVLEEVIRDDPNDVYALYYYGEILTVMRDQTAAQRILNRLGELEPRLAEDLRVRVNMMGK